MRVALNGFFWGQQHTGSGQYLHHLVYHVEPLVPISLLQPSDCARRFNLGKLLFEQAQVTRRAYACGADLLHVPYWAPPLRSRLPVVVTVHDLIPLLLPEYRRSVLVRAYTTLVVAATRRATHVIADSEATRRDLITHLRLPAERVTVVYLGVGKQFRPTQDRAAGRHEQERVRARERYGLPERYILYLGGFDPRKNVPLLLRAYAGLREQGTACPPLVIAGRLPARAAAGLADPRWLASSLGIKEQVRFIGWVREEDKPALYRAADVFVFPSHYEGFGLPVLEAMACGTAVVAAGSSSLPELVGDAGVLVAPDDELAVARALAELVADDEKRRALSGAAAGRARAFTWEHTARQTVGVWQEACSVHAA